MSPRLILAWTWLACVAVIALVVIVYIWPALVVLSVMFLFVIATMAALEQVTRDR